MQFLQRCLRPGDFGPAVRHAFSGLRVAPAFPLHDVLAVLGPLGTASSGIFDRSISKLYGAAGANGQYSVHSPLLDPNMRVLGHSLPG